MERFRPWDNLGCNVEDLKKVDDILKASNMDFEVEERPVLYKAEDGSDLPILDKKAIVRKDNQSLISEIKSKKSIIQNRDAFNFVDKLIDNYGATVERAGFQEKGKSSYMVMKLPNESIMGDDIEPYLIARNNFGGEGSNLEIFLSPFRLACANQINQAASKSKAIFKSNFYIDEKVMEPAMIKLLKIKDSKMENLNKEAQRLAQIKVSKDEFVDLIDQYYPTSLEAGLSNTTLNNNIRHKEGLMEAYNQEDLGNIRDTAWGVFNAFSDYLTHGRIKGELNGEEIDMMKRMAGALTGIQLLSIVKARMLKQYGYRGY